MYSYLLISKDGSLNDPKPTVTKSNDKQMNMVTIPKALHSRIYCFPVQLDTLIVILSGEF